MIFIMSPPHSGSTLLRNMLAQHPKLFSPPELYLLSFTTMGERHKAFWDRIWLLKGLIQTFQEIYDIDYDTAAAMIKQMEEQDLPTVLVYAMIQAKIGDRILVDKSPMNAGDFTNLAVTMEAFNRPLLIHLYRHPLSGINTYMRRPDQIQKLSKPEEEVTHDEWCAIQRAGENTWLGSHISMLVFKQHHPEHYYPMQYEALVKHPEKSMEDFCKFAGLDFDVKMLNPYGNVDRAKMQRATPKEFPMGDPDFYKHESVDADLANRWKEVNLPQAVDKSTQMLAGYFGYHFPKNYVRHTDHMLKRLSKQKEIETGVKIKPPKLKYYPVKVGEKTVQVPAFSAKEAKILLTSMLQDATKLSEEKALLEMLGSLRKKAALKQFKLAREAKVDQIPDIETENASVKRYQTLVQGQTLCVQGLDQSGQVVAQRTLHGGKPIISLPAQNAEGVSPLTMIMRNG
ncbi:MAG: polyketide synthase module [Gammaproteobacteria bacterium]|nr:polyketide synthase module [Gammaproteobacteria bacterium]